MEANGKARVEEEIEDRTVTATGNTAGQREDPFEGKYVLVESEDPQLLETSLTFDVGYVLYGSNPDGSRQSIAAVKTYGRGTSEEKTVNEFGNPTNHTVIKSLDRPTVIDANGVEKEIAYTDDMPLKEPVTINGMQFDGLNDIDWFCGNTENTGNAFTAVNPAIDSMKDGLAIMVNIPENLLPLTLTETITLNLNGFGVRPVKVVAENATKYQDAPYTWCTGLKILSYDEANTCWVVINPNRTFAFSAEVLKYIPSIDGMAFAGNTADGISRRSEATWNSSSSVYTAKFVGAGLRRPNKAILLVSFDVTNPEDAQLKVEFDSVTNGLTGYILDVHGNRPSAGYLIPNRYYWLTVNSSGDFVIISAEKASDSVNDSEVEGETVAGALNTLNTKKVDDIESGGGLVKHLGDTVAAYHGTPFYTYDELSGVIMFRKDGGATTMVKDEYEEWQQNLVFDKDVICYAGLYNHINDKNYIATNKGIFIFGNGLAYDEETNTVTIELIPTPITEGTFTGISYANDIGHLIFFGDGIVIYDPENDLWQTIDSDNKYAAVSTYDYDNEHAELFIGSSEDKGIQKLIYRYEDNSYTLEPTNIVIGTFKSFVAIGYKNEEDVETYAIIAGSDRLFIADVYYEEGWFIFLDFVEVPNSVIPNGGVVNRIKHLLFDGFATYIVLLTTTGLYRGLAIDGEWRIVSEPLRNGNVIALAYSHLDSQLLFITDDAGIFRVDLANILDYADFLQRWLNPIDTNITEGNFQVIAYTESTVFFGKGDADKVYYWEPLQDADGEIYGRSKNGWELLPNFEEFMTREKTITINGVSQYVAENPIFNIESGGLEDVPTREQSYVTGNTTSKIINDDNSTDQYAIAYGNFAVLGENVRWSENCDFYDIAQCYRNKLIYIATELGLYCFNSQYNTMVLVREGNFDTILDSFESTIVRDYNGNWFEIDIDTNNLISISDGYGGYYTFGSSKDGKIVLATDINGGSTLIKYNSESKQFEEISNFSNTITQILSYRDTPWDSEDNLYFLTLEGSGNRYILAQDTSGAFYTLANFDTNWTDAILAIYEGALIYAVQFRNNATYDFYFLNRNTFFGTVIGKPIDISANGVIITPNAFYRIYEMRYIDISHIYTLNYTVSVGKTNGKFASVVIFDDNSVTRYDVLTQYNRSLGLWNPVKEIDTSKFLLKESPTPQVINSDLVLDTDKTLLGTSNGNQVPLIGVKGGKLKLTDVPIGYNLRGKTIVFERTDLPVPREGNDWVNTGDYLCGCTLETHDDNGVYFFWGNSTDPSAIGCFLHNAGELVFDADVYYNGTWSDTIVTFPDTEDIIVEINNLPAATDGNWGFDYAYILDEDTTTLGNTDLPTVIESAERPKVKTPNSEEEVAYKSDLAEVPTLEEVVESGNTLEDESGNFTAEFYPEEINQFWDSPEGDFHADSRLGVDYLIKYWYDADWNDVLGLLMQCNPNEEAIGFQLYDYLNATALIMGRPAKGIPLDFYRNGKPLLSADPEQGISDEDAAEMRNKLQIAGNLIPVSPTGDNNAVSITNPSADVYNVDVNMGIVTDKQVFSVNSDGLNSATININTNTDVTDMPANSKQTFEIFISAQGGTINVTKDMYVRWVDLTGLNIPNITSNQFSFSALHCKLVVECMVSEDEVKATVYLYLTGGSFAN